MYERLTRYWQKRGRNASLNICNSIGLWCKIQTAVFQTPRLRQYPNRYMALIIKMKRSIQLHNLFRNISRAFFTAGIAILFIISFTNLTVYPYELTGAILIGGIVIILLSVIKLISDISINRAMWSNNFILSWFVVVLFIMVFISTLFSRFNIWSIYLINIALLIVLIKNLLNDKLISKNQIYNIISAVSVGVIIVVVANKCINLNIYTHLLSNNNIVAMFLAMSLPFFVSRVKFNFVIFLLVYFIYGIVILMLESRTGMIGLIIGFVFTLFMNLKDKYLYSKFKSNTIIFSFVSIFFIGLLYLNTRKSESTDGRLIIWGNAIEVIRNQPLNGYGFGSFGKRISMEFSKYFSRFGNIGEQDNITSHINVAYNDLIQLTIESGIVGLIFWSLLIVLISIEIFNKEVDSATISLLLFVIMGLTNTILYAVPCGYLLAVILALKIDYFRSIFHFSNYINAFILSLNLLVMILYLYTIYYYEGAIRTTNNIAKSDGTHYVANLNILRRFQNILHSSEFYWMTVSINFYKSNKLNEAKKAVNNAIDLSYSASAFDLLARINGRLNDTKELDNLILARSIAPGLIYHKYRLFDHYQKTCDTINAKDMANEIILHNKKGTLDISFYQKEARKYLLNEK